MTIGYSSSPRTMRRAMRDQQVHVRSHGLSTPLLVGSTVVQWHESTLSSYFYRPADAGTLKGTIRRAQLLLFIVAQNHRAHGEYHKARDFLSASRHARRMQK